MNMGNYASSCAMRFATAVLLIGSSLWMPSLSRANDNNPCLETGTWNPCNEECVPGSITQADWDPPGNLFYACVGETFVPPKITVTTSDGKIVCNNGVNTLVCSDSPYFGQNPNSPDQAVPYIGSGYFEPPIPTLFPFPGLYHFVGKAKASPAFGSCPDIYPQTIGTLTVKALKFMFRPPYVDVCWSDGGSYEASGDLTFDSYDTSAMSWTLETLEGDPSAWIDPDSGKVYYGTEGGGKYNISVQSSEAHACEANMSLHIESYDITTSPDNPWAGDVVSYKLSPKSYIPLHDSVHWTAPNDFYECESDAAQPPTALGGQFRIPNHKDGDYTVAVSASCGTVQKTVTSQCKDCTDLLVVWKEALNKHNAARDAAINFPAPDELRELNMLQEEYYILGQGLRGCLLIHLLQNVPDDPFGGAGEAVRAFVSELSEQLFQPNMEEEAMQLANRMDQIVPRIKILTEKYAPLYCEFRKTLELTKPANIAATACIMSVEARKLCESTQSELSSAGHNSYPYPPGNPCEVVNPDLYKPYDNWRTFDTLSFWGKRGIGLNQCN